MKFRVIAASNSKNGGKNTTGLIFFNGFSFQIFYDGEDIKIARLNSNKIENDISVLDMHYLIAERNKDVKYFEEKHEVGLFDINKFLEIMNKAGFEAEFLERLDVFLIDSGIFY